MATDAPDATATLTLYFDETIEFSGKSATEVVLREPTVAEYVAASAQPGFGQTQALLVSVGKLPPGIAAKVPISKVRVADEFFGRFLSSGPAQEVVPEAPQPGDAELFAGMQLREPTIAELQQSALAPLSTAKLVSLVTGIPFDVAQRMPVSVARRADEFFTGFATPSRPTGNS